MIGVDDMEKRCVEPIEQRWLALEHVRRRPTDEARRMYQRPVAEVQVSNRITPGPDLTPQSGLWIDGSRMLGFHPVWRRRLRRCDLSADWRRIDGRLQMIAVLAIPGPSRAAVALDRAIDRLGALVGRARFCR